MKYVNKSYLCLFSLFLCAFPSCSFWSIQIMVKHGLIFVFYESETVLFCSFVLWRCYFTKLRARTASVLQKTKVRPCAMFCHFLIELRLQEGKAQRNNDRYTGMICLSMLLKKKHLVSSRPWFNPTTASIADIMIILKITAPFGPGVPRKIVRI